MMIVCWSIMQHNVTGRRPELLLNATTCLLRPNIQCQSTTNNVLIMAPTNVDFSLFVT